MPLDGPRSGPLICTDHSVRMIQRDIKLVSRRVIKRPKGFEDMCDACWFGAKDRCQDDLVEELTGEPTQLGQSVGLRPYLDVPACNHVDRRKHPQGLPATQIRSPYGKRGDRLWIRETCREIEDGGFVYRADYEEDEAREKGPWKNVRFVPKCSARIWLELVDVRPERLQEITAEDVVMEGVCAEDRGVCRGVWPISTFATLWDELNGRRGAGVFSWERNPWVWRLSFCRVAP